MELNLKGEAAKKFDEFVKEFKFGEPTKGNPMTLISGIQGSGKTHLALSATKHFKNVFLLDTELRGNLVATKFDNVQYAKVTTYLQLVGIVYSIVNNYKEGVVIIDSATDLQQLAELRYKEVAKLEKIWPQYLWAHIYDMIDYIIKMFRKTDFQVIFTSRMKEEYLNDKATGKMLPRVYNRLPYNMDIMMELTRTDKGRELLITKDGYNDYNGKVPYTDDIMAIINNLKEGKYLK